MRTTINLDEDVLRAVRSLAREQGKSLGAIVSALVRKALRAQEDPSYSGDFPVFKVRKDAPPITPEMVEAAQEDL
ncbi:MAG: ribbon-helix-helix protein, CopG family [Gemmatimonadota bacterium]|jgi:hypothetical protein